MGIKTSTNIKYGYITRIVFSIFLFGLFLYSYSDYHLNRNKCNLLPIGHLIEIEQNLYEDEVGLIWELQPNIKNEFHQATFEETLPAIPYSILENPPKFNSDYPYLKLLSVQKNCSSFEAILSPNNKYLTTSSKRGTFNYASPNGFWGNFKHVFLDVIPHFICSDYE